MEITIDRLKGIALHIKIEAANDLGLKDERFKGIVEGLDRAIKHFEEVAKNDWNNKKNNWRVRKNEPQISW